MSSTYEEMLIEDSQLIASLVFFIETYGQDSINVVHYMIRWVMITGYETHKYSSRVYGIFVKALDILKSENGSVTKVINFLTYFVNKHIISFEINYGNDWTYYNPQYDWKKRMGRNLMKYVIGTNVANKYKTLKRLHAKRRLFNM